jgi:hypothetical protein
MTQVGRIFGTPLVIKGKTWLPAAQLIAWLVMAWVAGKQRPERNWKTRLGVGALTMPVVLGSEWGHNLAHAAAARLVGKPMDALWIVGGMPRLQYADVQDAQVTPRQHIQRAAGGPAFNALLVPVAWLAWHFSWPGSLAREVSGVALGTNLFLSTVAFMPIPGIDGGPVLKWSLVERGLEPGEADLVVRRVDGLLGSLLAGLCLLAFKKRRWILGGLLAQFAAFALAAALGLVREEGLAVKQQGSQPVQESRV